MAFRNYCQVSKERYDIIKERYTRFQDTLKDPNIEPVKVFDPLPQKLLDELEMIRHASKGLQAKKDEDVAKAAQAEMVAAEEAAKREAENKQKQEKDNAGETTEGSDTPKSE